MNMRFTEDFSIVAEEYVSHLKSAKEIFAARDEAAKRVKEET